MSTIFAVSSGAPPAAIAVLRISGPDALSVSASLAGPLPPDRRASLRILRDPADDTMLDRALVLVFTGPTTATGEDLVEFHLHGGRAVVSAVERVLAGTGGLRHAEPGEFTRRALANGRIDLTEAEGLGDLLAAETEHQRRAAMLIAQGGIRRRVEDWSARLLDLSAQIEAEIDFSDEDDVTAAGIGTLHVGLAALARDMQTVLAQPPVERLYDGIRVVLAGPPNSGKSSLFNVMADRDAAIVSPIAGTTRDRIDVAVRRNGFAYSLTDTAGLADRTDDPIEAIGIERAHDAIMSADIVLWLGEEAVPDNSIWLHARCDRHDRLVIPGGRDIAISSVTRQGIDDLWVLIERRSTMLLPRIDTIALNVRQRDLVSAAATAIESGLQVTDILLVADDILRARQILNRVTGHTDTEAMLDMLFARFCIGK